MSSENAIKPEAINELEHRWRNRAPGDSWERYIELTNQLVESLMTAEVQDDFTMEELNMSIKKLKRCKSPGSNGYR